MKIMLLSGAPHFAGAVLVEGAAALIADGHDVSYVSWAAPSQALADAVATIIVLGPVPAGGEGQRPPAPPRSQVDRRLRQVRTLLRRHPSRLWSAARRDADVQRLASGADALVAVDPHATLAVWQLARRYPQPQAISSLGAAASTLAPTT
jgi:hypothetical protein